MDRGPGRVKDILYRTRHTGPGHYCIMGVPIAATPTSGRERLLHAPAHRPTRGVQPIEVSSPTPQLHPLPHHLAPQATLSKHVQHATTRHAMHPSACKPEALIDRASTTSTQLQPYFVVLPFAGPSIATSAVQLAYQIWPKPSCRRRPCYHTTKRDGCCR